MVANTFLFCILYLQVSKEQVNVFNNSFSGSTYTVKYLGIVDGTMGILSRKMALPGNQSNIAAYKDTVPIIDQKKLMPRSNICQPVLGNKSYTKSVNRQQVDQQPLPLNQQEESQARMITPYNGESPINQSKLQAKNFPDAQIYSSSPQTAKNNTSSPTLSLRQSSQYQYIPSKINQDNLVITLKNENQNFEVQANQETINKNKYLKDPLKINEKVLLKMGLQLLVNLSLKIVIIKLKKTLQRNKTKVDSQLIEINHIMKISKDQQNNEEEPNHYLSATEQQQLNEKICGYPKPELYDQHFINKYSLPKGLQTYKKPEDFQKKNQKQSLYDMSQPQLRKGIAGWKLTKRPLQTSNESKIEQYNKSNPRTRRQKGKSLQKGQNQTMSNSYIAGAMQYQQQYGSNQESDEECQITNIKVGQ